jgi:O-antigen ligase
MLILCPILAAFLFGAIVLNQPAAFVFLLCYSPLDQELPEGMPYRVVPVILRFVAFLAVVVAYRLRGKSMRELIVGDTLTKLLLCWWGTILFSFFVSRNFFDWGERALLISGSMFASYFVFKSWLRNQRKVATVCLILTGVIAISGLMGVIQILAGGYTSLFTLLHGNSVEMTEWANRATGLSAAGPNAYAGFLNLFLPFGIGCLFCRIFRAYRSWILISVGLACIGLVLSGCRGGVAALAFTFLIAILVFVQGRKRRWITATAFVLLVPILATAVALLSPRLTDVDENESVLIRYAIWGEAARLYLEHPVIGIGLGNFRESFDTNVIPAAPGQLDVHNLYLQILAETGTIGFLVFMSLFSFVIWRAYKNLSLYPRGSLAHAVSFATLAAVLSMLIHGWVDFLFLSGPEFGGGLAIVLATFSATMRLPEMQKLEATFMQAARPGPLLPEAI